MEVIALIHLKDKLVIFNAIQDIYSLVMQVGLVLVMDNGQELIHFAIVSEIILQCLLLTSLEENI